MQLYNAAMKRLLLIFLIVLLPLQTAWAAGLCRIVGSVAVAGTVAILTDSASEAQLFDTSAEQGCGTVCPAGCTLPAVAISSSLILNPLANAEHTRLPPELDFESHISDGPQRPKWFLRR